MPDITTAWPPLGAYGDWAMAGADLASGSDLETAVLISIATDRVADPDDVIPDGTGDPRGWVGDADSDRPIGSKVWLRLRSKRTPELLKTVADDLRDALQWLLDDKVVSSIEVATEWQEPRRLASRLTLHRTGGQPLTLEYAWAWEGI